jgi:NADH-quinone oxidoreductase subunit L
MTAVAALLLLLPLAAAAVNGLFGRALDKRMHGKLPGVIATAAAAGCFVLSVVAFFQVVALPEEARSLAVPLYTWLDLGAGAQRLAIDVGLLLDPLSVTWALVVTGVGSLIFLYSIAYMEHEEGRARYFAYLSLFLFSMLVLVLGGNLVLTFVGWEGVGLCSYLLIGFDYGKSSAADAGRKAFLVNRIGDVGFLIAMFWTWSQYGTLDHVALKIALVGVAAVPALLALGYFVGATGKSAQLPLFVWLPDAMAGPTPVSALIHAATMVTAGIYLLCRLSPLFVLAEGVLDVVAWVGALTALFSGLIALRQRDIKKVLAYSTVSQLGYMFLGCGVHAFSSAAFHVVTHAFFKALLFLGAGAVIHALHGEQDLWKMGGLKRQLPKTARAMKIGALALAGIPPLAGFFSKDEILGAAFNAGMHGHVDKFVLWGVGVVTAALTAFYSARLIALCFEGESRLAPDVHPHEAPAAMAIPLQVLAVLSVIGGLGLGIEAVGWMPLHHWLAPSLASAPEGGHLSAFYTWALLLLAALVAVLFWRVGSAWFRADFAAPRRLELQFPRAARALAGRFWVDEIYDRVVVRPLRGVAELCLEFDVRVVDGLYHLAASFSALLATGVRILQNGVVHAYAFWFIAGAAFFLWLATRA